MKMMKFSEPVMKVITLKGYGCTLEIQTLSEKVLNLQVIPQVLPKNILGSIGAENIPNHFAAPVPWPRRGSRTAWRSLNASWASTIPQC
jgi:hypothetical protein